MIKILSYIIIHHHTPIENRRYGTQKSKLAALGVFLFSIFKDEKGVFYAKSSTSASKWFLSVRSFIITAVSKT